METKIQMQSMPEPNHSRDYRNALIVGLLIGIFALPTLNQIFEQGKYSISNPALIYIAVLAGMPVISLAGIFIAKMLVSKIRSLWEFAKFVLVGVSNTLVDIGILNFLIGMTGITKGLSLSLIGAVAFIAATINSYIWNAHWSFQTNTPRSVSEMLKFFAVTLGGLFIKTAVIYISTTLFTQTKFSPELWANISNLMAIVLTLVWNFFGFKLFVFKTPSVKPEDAMPAIEKM